jgi:hypothetical protein
MAAMGYAALTACSPTPERCSIGLEQAARAARAMPSRHGRPRAQRRQRRTTRAGTAATIRSALQSGALELRSNPWSGGRGEEAQFQGAAALMRDLAGILHRAGHAGTGPRKAAGLMPDDRPMGVRAGDRTDASPPG